MSGPERRAVASLAGLVLLEGLRLGAVGLGWLAVLVVRVGLVLVPVAWMVVVVVLRILLGILLIPFGRG